MNQLKLTLLVLQICKHFASKHTLFGSENHALHSLERSGAHVGKSRHTPIGKAVAQSLQKSRAAELFAADLIALKKNIQEWQFPSKCEDRTWTPVEIPVWGVGGSIIARKLALQETIPI
jgi:hypothetical protein